MHPRAGRRNDRGSLLEIGWCGSPAKVQEETTVGKQTHLSRVPEMGSSNKIPVHSTVFQSWVSARAPNGYSLLFSFLFLCSFCLCVSRFNVLHEGQSGHMEAHGLAIATRQ